MKSGERSRAEKSESEPVYALTQRSDAAAVKITEGSVMKRDDWMDLERMRGRKKKRGMNPDITQPAISGNH